MTQDYQVIDADGHVLEPVTMWDQYIDPGFRGRGPTIEKHGGEDKLIIDGTNFSSEGNFGGAGAVGITETLKLQSMDYTDGRAGGFDPRERIKDLDLDGIDAVFLYPTVGLFAMGLADPQLAGAICRAYNRWLADYCSASPDRLHGVAMLPMQSVELAIEEMTFARKELGMKAGFVRPNPYHGKMIGDPFYDRFWAAAQDLDLAIGFHEGGIGQGGIPVVGIDRFSSQGARHIISHTMEMMLVAMSVIWGGVCERFPNIRIAFLESGGGWIAPWLDRMDRHFDQPIFNDSGLKTRPSELFKRNCWISFEPVEKSLNVLADYIGPEKILWATDYPHPDGFFPGAVDMIKQMPGLSESTRRQVLAGGARAFYGLH